MRPSIATGQGIGAELSLLYLVNCEGIGAAAYGLGVVSGVACISSFLRRPKFGFDATLGIWTTWSGL